VVTGSILVPVTGHAQADDGAVEDIDRRKQSANRKAQNPY
jgi:hypothetical protein